MLNFGLQERVGCLCSVPLTLRFSTMSKSPRAVPVLWRPSFSITSSSFRFGLDSVELISVSTISMSRGSLAVELTLFLKAEHTSSCRFGLDTVELTSVSTISMSRGSLAVELTLFLNAEHTSSCRFGSCGIDTSSEPMPHQGVVVSRCNPETHLLSYIIWVSGMGVSF